MARQWQQLSLEGAKRHPLYGIKNWLAVFAFGILIAPFRSIGGVSNAAREAGLTLSQLLNADISTGAFVTASMAFDSVAAGLLLWLLFSKNRHFRVASISLLVLQWPAYFVVAFITGGTKIPGFVGVFVFQFFGGLLLTVIWVAYLQRSRRVRVTFENCVVVEKKSTSQIRGNGMPVPTTQASSSGNDAYAAALAEIEEGRLDKGVWARSFAEAGGDESKAKAIYIKARAGAAKNAVVWEDTQPVDVEPDVKVVGAETIANNNLAPTASPWSTAVVLSIAGVVGIAGAIAAFALYMHDDYTKRQEVRAPTQQPEMEHAVITPGKTVLDEQQRDAADAYLRKDYATALRLFQTIAAQGLAVAQFNLGMMYKNGQGVAQDYVEAARWYGLAAGQGMAFAQFELGVMYEDGQGVARDYVEAARLYRLAAAQGNAEGQHNLGVIYANGQAVAQDHVRAHMWFNLAAAKGEASAVKNRDITARKMTPQQIALAQQMARDCQQRNFKGCD